ncbi:MAG: energy-coupling factor transporter ATP-binding protein EcfA2, partial [Myxococcota bacterium]
RAFESPHATCIVLVGPSGVGKSALIEALASGRPDDCLWRTSAAAMIRGLTSSGGWQDNLAQLCEELAESRDWLVVQNLPELFEVGRYVGNSTSMAESLRPLISRGGLRLITECTSEQAARLESRYPGFLDPFVQITIEEPTDLPALLTKRAAREAGRIPVAPGSVETLLRLLRRFSPYSGFPGRAVRFIEATCRAIREQGEGGALDSETVFSRFCAETGMPRALIDPATPLAIADIEAHFQKWIFGQPEAVAAVVDTLISVRAALTRPRRPIATLLFAGPTGVGKTETAKALAAFMFGSPDRMIRFDMSEFSSPGAALRLSDGPGGEGRLTGAIRRQPFSVLLLDEIEKADGMVFDLLLQVLGEGRLTDGQGRTADFCSSIVIMTSNIGARDAARPPSGFSRGGGHIRRLPEIYTEAVEKHFRPEFFNRIDRVVAFSALQPDAIASVLDRELSALSDGAGLRRRRASLDVSPQAQQHLITIGYNPAFGARHLQRALRRHLSAPVSAALNAIVSENPLTIHITESDGTLICDLEEHRQDRRAATAKQRLEEAADAIDDARRTARKVIAGAAFAELRSSLSILRRRRKRLKQSFWARSADVARLGRLEQIEADCRQMADEIADLSLKTDLSIMAGDGEAQPLEVALAEHTMHARQVRRALYEALSLDEKTIIVGVYGSIDRVAALIEVYIQAAESMGMPVKAADLWLRRDASTILPGETPAADGSTSPYLLSPPHDHRKEGVSVHVGVELRISGAGVASIFDGEEGILCWIEPTEHRVLVRVEAMDRPDYHRVRFSDLHRQSAVKGRPRLTFQDNQVTGHSKNATMLASDYADAFVGLLTERFHEHVLKAATQ